MSAARFPSATTTMRPKNCPRENPQPAQEKTPGGEDVKVRRDRWARRQVYRSRSRRARRSRPTLKRHGSRFHEVFFHLQVIDDEVLPLGGVLAHEEAQQVLAVVEMRERHGFEPDVFADEILELAGRDFAEAFEPRDLVARAEFSDRGLLFLL